MRPATLAIGSIALRLRVVREISRNGQGKIERKALLAMLSDHPADECVLIMTGVGAELIVAHRHQLVPHSGRRETAPEGADPGSKLN